MARRNVKRRKVSPPTDEVAENNVTLDDKVPLPKAVDKTPSRGVHKDVETAKRDEIDRFSEIGVKSPATRKCWTCHMKKKSNCASCGRKKDTCITLQTRITEIR